MTPILTAKVWPQWSSPIDGGKSLNGVRIFGDHKTWRGLITGMAMSQLAYLLEIILTGQVMATPWYFGFLLGLGALGGDMVKSFFKRRVGVASGKSWFPWDQIDWVIGLIAIGVMWNILTFTDILVLLIIGLLLHLITKAIGYGIKINQSII